MDKVFQKVFAILALWYLFVPALCRDQRSEALPRLTTRVTTSALRPYSTNQSCSHLFHILLPSSLLPQTISSFPPLQSACSPPPTQSRSPFFLPGLPPLTAHTALPSGQQINTQDTLLMPSASSQPFTHMLIAEPLPPRPVT